MTLKSRIDTAKDVLSDTRSRMIVIILVIIVAIVLTIAFIRLKRSQLPPAGLGSSMTGTPNIISIPGMGQPTREYAKLQEQQNIELATEAARKGTSAMPTVVRTTYADIGVSTDLTKESGAVSVSGCGVEELKRARAAGVNASELRCRGCSLAALKAAGFSVGELRSAGFGAQELKDAGFSASDLKAAGFSGKELSEVGFDVKELMAAGYTANELKGDRDKCEIKKLQEARSRGVAAAELRGLGCGIEALKAVGYTAEELRAAGFSAGELRSSGFSAEELKEAGFSADELKRAGFSAAALKDAGFSAEELKAAGYTDGDLLRAGVAISTASASAIDADSSSCSVASLKKARLAGVSAAELKNRGCSISALRSAGFTASELKAAGFNSAELKAAGFTANELKAAGFTASELKAAGFTASELKGAGFSGAELKNAGFGEKDLQAAGFATKEWVPCSAESITKARAAGTTVDQLKNMGCSAAMLKAAGVNAAELYIAGFSPDNLKNAGFEEKEVKVAKLQATGGLEAVAEQDAIGRISEDKIANMGEQEIDALLRQQQAMMMTQATQLFSAWTPVPSQQYVVGQTEDNKSAAGEKGEVSKEQQAAEILKNSDVYKAGTIVFAVLDTEVNSDETSPVMATVIQGPLKGSKVMGNFQRVAKKVLLQFSVLAVPKLNSSVAINAVAVDPNTAKTALASHVDNHYMLRYGTIFAASFISGLGQAFQSSGSQTQVTTVGTTTSFPQLNTMQKALVALGNVGQQMGGAISSKVNMPPTVKVKAGIGIGLLLMADLAIPKDQSQPQAEKLE